MIALTMVHISHVPRRAKAVSLRVLQERLRLEWLTLEVQLFINPVLQTPPGPCPGPAGRGLAWSAHSTSLDSDGIFFLTRAWAWGLGGGP